MARISEGRDWDISLSTQAIAGAAVVAGLKVDGWLYGSSSLRDTTAALRPTSAAGLHGSRHQESGHLLLHLISFNGCDQNSQALRRGPIS